MNTQMQTFVALSMAIAVPCVVFATDCWINVNRFCCSTLPDGDLPNLTRPGCPDSITSNPTISHFDRAGNGVIGKLLKVPSDDTVKCKWDVYEINSNGICVYSYSMERFCTPVGTAGGPCTGQPA